MKLASSAIQEGGTIPTPYTGDGADASPPLEWTGAPAAVQSYVLICDDPDAPRGTWVHWVLFNIPSESTLLPDGVPATPEIPGGGSHGKNDFKKLGYGGPSPPRGKPHRYYFKLYALDRKLELPAGPSKQQVEKAMEGHVLASAQLMGTFGRS